MMIASNKMKQLNCSNDSLMYEQQIDFSSTLNNTPVIPGGIISIASDRVRAVVMSILADWICLLLSTVAGRFVALCCVDWYSQSKNIIFSIKLRDIVFKSQLCDDLFTFCVILLLLIIIIKNVKIRVTLS